MRNVLIGCLTAGTLATALQYGQWLPAIAISVVWLFVLYGLRATQANGYVTVRGHSHPGPIARVARHEGGHGAAAELVGGRVTGARVTGNDRRASGYTNVLIPSDPASQVGVYLAGFYAAPGTDSPTDMKMVNRVLSGVPAPFRGSVLSAGQQIAHKAARSSRVDYYAKKLERHGRV